MKTEVANKLGPALDKFLNEPDFQDNYEKEFKEFALSELLLALMEDDGQSVRKLAKHTGISPTTIQNLKSGKNRDMKLSNFISIVKACGYKLEIVKNDKHLSLSDI